MSDSRSVGEYRLVANLGTGGMAHVHLAISSRTGGFQKLLVLKTLRAEFAEDPEFRRMFLDEARIAARLNHPNVVHTYEVGEDGGKIFIAMEYLEGQALSSVLARVGRDAMPLPAALRILSDALSGLHYAHELTDYDGKPFGLVHRDVSPQNVFVTYMGHAKILDFGIAKGGAFGGETKSGVIKGKVGYMSPEQVTGAPLDRRADVFAVGVMLWEVLAKARFVGKTEDEIVVITRRMQGTEKRIRDVAPDAPEPLLAICERAMAQNPDDRFPSALAMQEALDEYLARESNGDARAVAALLDLHFKEDRSKVRRVVEEGVRTLDTAGPMATVRTGNTLTTSSSSVEVPIPIVTELQRSPRRSYFLGGALVLLAFVGVGAAVALSRKTGDRVGTGNAAEPPPTAATSLPSSSATPTVARAPTAAPSIRVTVATVPKGATLTLDGVAVENPYRGTLPPGAHKFRAMAQGFRAGERVVQEDADLSIALDRVVAGDPGPAGEGLAPLPTGRPKKPRHAIDDSDPYK